MGIENSEYYASIDFSKCDSEVFESFPKKVVFDADVNIAYNNSIEKLPDEVIVSGDLNLNNSTIERLPNILDVGLRLSIDGCYLLKEIDGLYMFNNINFIDEYNIDTDKDLDLTGMSSLKKVSNIEFYHNVTTFTLCPILEEISDIIFGIGLIVNQCPKLKRITNIYADDPHLLDFDNCGSLESFTINRFTQTKFNITNISLVNCSSLVSLPDNLKIYEKLDIRGCSSLMTLPSSLDMSSNQANILVDDETGFMKRENWKDEIPSNLVDFIEIK